LREFLNHIEGEGQALVATMVAEAGQPVFFAEGTQLTSGLALARETISLYLSLRHEEVNQVPVDQRTPGGIVGQGRAVVQDDRVPDQDHRQEEVGHDEGGVEPVPHGLAAEDHLGDQAEDHVSREAKVSFSKMNDNFGSGYQAVGVAWRVLLAELDEVRKRGLSICLLGHAVVRQATDPQLGPFDQFTAQLPKTPWALTQRWADAVLFAAFDAARNEKESRAIVTGERLMFTVRGSGFEAKNRYNLNQKMPLSWKALDAAIATHRVADRPDRYEPRVKKRRRNHYGWLTEPRADIKRKMAKGLTSN